MSVNWEDLFRRYSDHVGMMEGVDFLDTFPCSGEEWEAICDGLDERYHWHTIHRPELDPRWQR